MVDTDEVQAFARKPAVKALMARVVSDAMEVGARRRLDKKRSLGRCFDVTPVVVQVTQVSALSVSTQVFLDSLQKAESDVLQIREELGLHTSLQPQQAISSWTRACSEGFDVNAFLDAMRPVLMTECIRKSSKSTVGGFRVWHFYAAGVKRLR